MNDYSAHCLLWCPVWLGSLHAASCAAWGAACLLLYADYALHIYQYQLVCCIISIKKRKARLLILLLLLLLLWRKGVDAIIEEYKRKWTGRETNRARYNPAEALGGGRQRARRGPGRPPGRRADNSKDKEILQHILDARKHKIRTNKR